jgi:hypothetical protein
MVWGMSSRAGRAPTLAPSFDKLGRIGASAVNMPGYGHLAQGCDEFAVTGGADKTKEPPTIPVSGSSCRGATLVTFGAVFPRTSAAGGSEYALHPGRWFMNGDPNKPCEIRQDRNQLQTLLCSVPFTCWRPLAMKCRHRQTAVVSCARQTGLRLARCPCHQESQQCADRLLRLPST